MAGDKAELIGLKNRRIKLEEEARLRKEIEEEKRLIAKLKPKSFLDNIIDFIKRMI